MWSPYSRMSEPATGCQSNSLPKNFQFSNWLYFDFFDILISQKYKLLFAYFPLITFLLKEFIDELFPFLYQLCNSSVDEGYQKRVIIWQEIKIKTWIRTRSSTTALSVTLHFSRRLQRSYSGRPTTVASIGLFGIVQPRDEATMQLQEEPLNRFRAWKRLIQVP